MRPGIIVQHGTLPARARDLVRGDVAGIIGIIPASRWPEGATAGDFLTLPLRRVEELHDHPQRELFDPAARRAVRAFFENGGAEVVLYGLCVEGLDDLRNPSEEVGPFAPLLHQLRSTEEIALLACPAAAWLPCEVNRLGQVRCDADALYDLLLDHCRQMIHRFLVVDAPRGLHGDLLLRWAAALRGRHPASRAFGAVYYPWLRAGDEILPPSGAVMGLFARSEIEHAPFGLGWPPANQPLHGVTHAEVELEWGEAGVIGDAGVNPIVVQPGRGPVVFGARTLSDDPRWRHINSRRVVSMITEQLRRDNEWAVFEPNEPSLWKVVERDVLVRLDQFWEAGLLTGARSQGEYSVECSEATNPADLRDQGLLMVQVTLRPVGTAERILIDLQLGSNEP